MIMNVKSEIPTHPFKDADLVELLVASPRLDDVGAALVLVIRKIKLDGRWWLKQENSWTQRHESTKSITEPADST